MVSIIDKRSYYEILGVSLKATQQEIKKSYRRLALKHHPDRNPKNKNSESKFREITEAYEVLGNSQKRSKYDESYAPSLSTTSFRHRSNANQFHWGEPSDELIRDIFRDILGYPFKHREKAEKGEDLRFHLSISFEVSALGEETKIEVPYFKLCPDCRGLRMKPGTGFKKCPRCKGKGTVKKKRGKLSYDSICKKCKGEKKIIAHPCSQCKGTGRIKLNRSLTIEIPPGVKMGTRLRVPGKGNPSLNGGSPGDLYIVININPHPFLERKGNDIIYHLPVSFPQASLGTNIEVPTLEGKAMIKIPPGIQSGEILRLKRKGIPYTKGTRRGDQQVIVEVKTPLKLTAKQKKLLKQFAQTS
jgi:molecular chaperone DnaJ